MVPDWSDIRKAADVLAGIAHRTPVMRSRLLDAACGNRVFLKCENLQRGGAFKFRGAFNAVHHLTDDQKARGVITYSSGNHGQALALVSSLAGTRCTVVMPRDAPRMKILAVREYGAEVVLYDPVTGSRQEIAGCIAAERGLTIVPPFDDPHVIAGQGTATLELLEEAGPLDYLFTPCGGGGLLSGTALAARHFAPGCKVVGVEPEKADDAVRSFRSGILQTVSHPDTIADGARTASLGILPFAIIRDCVDDMLSVSDEDLIATMHFVWTRMKLVVEPTGVLGLAAVFRSRFPVTGKRIGVILSGGNADVVAAGRWFVEAGL
jgi:threo-3-hydroxy-L-aspartate ammonia-lyase